MDIFWRLPPPTFARSGMKTLLIVTLLAVPSAASGQALGSRLTGTVTDPAGAPLDGAAVTITQLQTGRKHELKTSVTGSYRAIGLIPGEYELTAARTGFTTVTRRLSLLVDADATVNFMLD